MRYKALASLTIEIDFIPLIVLLDVIISLACPCYFEQSMGLIAVQRIATCAVTIGMPSHSSTMGSMMGTYLLSFTINPQL